jgi:hypothetical protein
MAVVLAGASGGLAVSVARAADIGPSLPTSAELPAPATGNIFGDYFADWDRRVAAARASQPEWSSPVITTTALLEQRFRFDTAFQHSNNGTDTIDLDGGKGVDLIVGDTTEIQIAAAPYYIRTTPGKSDISGFNDWPFFRIKERLFSSPEDAGDYVISAWLQTQAATGIYTLTNHAFTLLPTLGFGKGFGPFIVQGTLGGAIPTAYQSTLGSQVAGNLAFQYHLWQVLWPQIEVNWTHYIGGPRDGKDQVFLTPGVVFGKFSVTDRLKFTLGVGYQVAVEPKYQPSPLLPTHNHSLVVSTRLTF